METQQNNPGEGPQSFDCLANVTNGTQCGAEVRARCGGAVWGVAFVSPYCCQTKRFLSISEAKPVV